MRIPKKIKLRCIILEGKDLVYIFSDGSSLGNPGPGGYGVLLRFKNYEKENQNKNHTNRLLRGST